MTKNSVSLRFERWRRAPVMGALCMALLTVAPSVAQYEDGPGDVPYVPTPQQVVDGMLELGGAKKSDVVFDLGCGDGRIVVTAAKKFGARGTGVDINPTRISEAQQNAREAGVTDRVKFVEGNLFDADFHEATLVTLYLLPEVNLRLRPKLLRDLKPGSRIVSHSFDMGDWKPDKTVDVDGRVVHLWVVTDRAKREFGGPVKSE
jgi:SAM-dependent methyltransferase